MNRNLKVTGQKVRTRDTQFRHLVSRNEAITKNTAPEARRPVETDTKKFGNVVKIKKKSRSKR